MAEGVSKQIDESVCEKTCLSCYNKIKEDLKKEVVGEVLKTLNPKVIVEQPAKKNLTKSASSEKISVALDNYKRLFGTPLDKVVHYGVYCDNCDQQIIGIRYKCGNCEDYDLCEKCEDSAIEVHDMSHIFLKMRIPSLFFFTKNGAKKKIYQIPMANTNTKEKKTESDSSTRVRSLADLSLQKETCPKSSIQPWDSREHWARSQFDNLPNGMVILPGEQFTKTWQILNAGTLPWTKDTVFQLLWGHQGLKPSQTSVPAPHLKPGQQGTVSVTFTGPELLGRYESYWEFRHMGRPMGDTFWCSIRVDSTLPSVNINSRLPLIKALKAQHQQRIIKYNRKMREEKEKKKKKESRKKDAKHISEALNAMNDIETEFQPLNQRLCNVTLSQTATPNNTPFDLTPPKSPEPHDFINVKHEFSLSCNAMGDGAGKPLEEAGISVSDGEEKASTAHVSSSESDSEFVVIPMPKCFSLLESYPSVQVETGLSNSTVEGLKNHGSSLTNSSSPRRLEERISKETGVPEEILTMISFSDLSEEAPLMGSSSFNVSPTSSISIITGGHNSDEEVKKEDTQSEPPLIPPFSEETLDASSCTFPKFPVSIDQPTNDAAPLDPTMEGPVQVLPKGLVNGALLAAASVYNKARAVMSNLQPAMNELQEYHVTLPEALTPNEQLVEMGFCNKSLNEFLLKENNNDVALVVAELINLSDNDWHAARHTSN